MKSYSCGQYSDIVVQVPNGLKDWELSSILCPVSVTSSFALESQLVLAIPLCVPWMQDSVGGCSFSLTPLFSICWLIPYSLLGPPQYMPASPGALLLAPTCPLPSCLDLYLLLDSS